MSLQHSHRNQPGFMHSANALVWHCTLCLPRHSSTPCQIVRDNLLWMPPYGRLNFRYDCQSDKVIKNYHLEIPINGQNMIVQHVYECDWFTGTIQKMIISNKMNIKKIMDLQACHDNLTCSPYEWAEQSIIQMKLRLRVSFSSSQDIPG